MSKCCGMEVHPAAELFPLVEGEEYKKLVANIREQGLIESIEIITNKDFPDGAILDGRNRMRACTSAGVKPRFHQWRGESPTQWVLSKNLTRRHLSVSQRAILANEMLPLLEAEAKKRQSTSRGKSEVAKKPSAEDKGRARDKAGKHTGVSGRSVQKAKNLLLNAPDVHKAVKEGIIDLDHGESLAKLSRDERTRLIAEVKAAPDHDARKSAAKKASKASKEIHRTNLVTKIAGKAMPPPEGPFDVVCIDPPWKYDLRDADVSHRGRVDYPAMTEQEIMALEVGKLASESAIVFLWITNAHMLELGAAKAILRAWGFTGKTIITWVKTDEAGEVKMGVGHWMRGATEHCIMAVRGTPFHHLTNQTTALMGLVREHSRKPEEFYLMVESLCPGSKLDMFSREPRAGWAQWGAEQNKFAKAAS